MTSRNRVLAAIRHEVPDRIPVDAICIENQPQIAAWLGIDVAHVPDALGLDGCIVSAPYTGPAPAAGTNEWGTTAVEDYGTVHRYPLATVTTVAEVERYPWPDPAHYDFVAAAQCARAWATRYAVRGPYWKPLFCQVCSLFGLEETLVRMVTNTPVFEAALEQVFQHVATFCERLLDACGDALPILCLGDDFATQRGLMLSPQQWRRFLKPRYAALFALAKKRGKPVWFHSCGDVTPVLADLIDIGIDVWETVQLHTLPLSAETLKREYGRHLTFFGGVNTQRLPFIAPEEVAAETRRCIEVLGRNGGYICGPDHHIKPDVPPVNAVALFRTATTFRAEGYTRSQTQARGRPSHPVTPSGTEAGGGPP